MKSLLKPLILTLPLLPSSALACEEPKVSGYDTVDCLYEELSIVEKNDQWGFIDRAGKIIIPMQYDGAWSFSEDLASVMQNDK